MSKQKIFEIVTSHAREVVPELEGHSFQLEQSLKDLGANSIDRSEILMMTLESLDISVPLVEFAGVDNIAGMVERISKNLSAVQ